MMNRAVSEKVWAEALRLGVGDVEKTRRWYFQVPLRELGDLTAAQAVDQGRESDVLRLLEMYECGYLG